MTFGWTASASPNIAEYILSYGTVSGTYTYTNNVGLATTATLTNLQAGTTYYFILTDINTFGLESIPSAELSFTLPSSALTNLVITWPNPANIVYGTPLSASQLNAKANVPGSFVYKPPAGRVLLAGNSEELTATFTPVNTTNYNVVTNKVAIKVLQAPLTITANNMNKVYGAGVPALTARYSGFVNGNTTTNLATPVALITAASSASHVGIYPITAIGATSPNYLISFVSGSLTVTPAGLTISANNASMPKGSPVPPLTASYNGFVNGDTAAVLATPVSLGTTANSNSPQGTYPIVASAAKSANYAIAFVNGVLTVKPPQLVSMKVTSSTNSISVGQTEQLTASGTFSDHSTQNLTTNATWLSSAPTVATVSSSGLVLANAAGSSTITAAQSSIIGTFAFTVMSTNGPTSMSFTNSTAIVISSSGAASPYPSAISVSGVQGIVSQATVQLNNVSHESPEDMAVLLVSPTGQPLLLMSGAGGNYSITNVTLTFDETASAGLPKSRQITSGVYRPTDDGIVGILPDPAPAGLFASVLAVFNGILPNGTWMLYVADTLGNSSGIIAGGWSLTITSTGNGNSANVANAPLVRRTDETTVMPPAQMEIEHVAVLPGGQVELALKGQPGQAYLLEMSIDLVHWNKLKIGAFPDVRLVYVDQTSTLSIRRFYRVSTAR